MVRYLRFNYVSKSLPDTISSNQQNLKTRILFLFKKDITTFSFLIQFFYKKHRKKFSI